MSGTAVDEFQTFLRQIFHNNCVIVIIAVPKGQCVVLNQIQRRRQRIHITASRFCYMRHSAGSICKADTVIRKAFPFPQRAIKSRVSTDTEQHLFCVRIGYTVSRRKSVFRHFMNDFQCEIIGIRLFAVLALLQCKYYCIRCNLCRSIFHFARNAMLGHGIGNTVQNDAILFCSAHNRKQARRLTAPIFCISLPNIFDSVMPKGSKLSAFCIAYGNRAAFFYCKGHIYTLSILECKLFCQICFQICNCNPLLLH